MTAFVEAGLGNALVALLLAVVALVAGLVCRRPAVAHALWLLVLIKLVTPPLMSVSLPWPEEAARVREEPRSPVTVEEVPFEVEEPFSEPREAPPETVEVAPIEDFPTPEIPYAAPSWQAAFGLVWLAGSLTWFAVAARRLWRFARLLRHARPASAELAERVVALSKTLGLRNPPRILLVQGHLSPMVWALGRVTLLVPAKLVATMSDAALDTLLAHELAHIRRRDHWVRWLELVGLGLYWWNPVVWLARRELRQAEELCCDAWVVRCLPDARRVYATALVDALDFLSRPDEPVPALGCGLGRVDDLKWRLTMILRGQTSPRLGWTTTLGVFGLAVLLLPLVPGFSPAQPQAKTTTAKPSLDQLEPETRVKVENMINVLLRQQADKQAAEQKVKEERLARVARLEDQIAEGSKQAEQMQALRADIAAKMMALKQLEAKLGATKDSKNEGGYGFRRVETTVKPGDGAMFRVEFAVKGDAQEIKAALEKIEKALKQPHVTIIEVRLDPRSMQPANPASGGKSFGKTFGGSGGMKSPPQKDATSSDRRIDALEKKLDAVLKELEALRKPKAAPSRGKRVEDPFGRTPSPASPEANPPKPSPRPGARTEPLPTPPAPPLPGIGR